MATSNSLRGMRSQRTLQTIRKDNEATKENADFLKLFMLEKERTRLRNEQIRLNLRNDILSARLKEIEEFYTATLGSNEFTTPKAESMDAEKPAEKEEWKTMPLKY
jgi:hypothetical protein